MKFVTDCTLGKLSKWLRILGYDTVAYQGLADTELLRSAEREERFVLTRKKTLQQTNNRILHIIHDTVGKQLREVTEKLSISPDPQKFFSRCIRCNVPLLSISRNEVADRIPEYVQGISDSFLECPYCKKIYWPGTHRKRMQDMLKCHIHGHPL